MRVRSLGLALLFLTAGCNPEISYGGRHPDLAGRVMVDGVPAAGVTVVANTADGEYRVQSGPGGTYAFNQIPSGAVRVRAEAPFVIFEQTQPVELGNGEVKVNLTGYGPVAASGSILWEFAMDRSIGIAGVPVNIDGAFATDAVQSGTDGAYRIPRAPGYGTYEVVYGALPSGLAYRYGGGSTRRVVRSANRDADTAYVTYQPAARLYVDVRVDGRSYNTVTVDINTPLPARGGPGGYSNLPVQLLTVAISGFDPSISFDSTTKQVQLRPNESETARFDGYTPGANRPPVVTLIAPANGATFTAGTPITFRGSAQDPEDGELTGNALDWFVNAVGGFGRGNVVTVDTLAVGQHRVLFRATDSGGNWAWIPFDVVIAPATGGRVVGTVTSNGTPVANARVDLHTTPSRFILTDALGAYAFEDVPAGSYVVGVQPVSCVTFPATSQSLTVAIGARTTVNFAGARLTPCSGDYIVPGRTPPYKVERWNGGTVERWNGGTVERWNGGTVERRVLCRPARGLAFHR